MRHIPLPLCAISLLAACPLAPLSAQGITCPTAAGTNITADSIAKCVHALDSISLTLTRHRARDAGNSYVQLSLIKSVAGQIPATEFFDLRFKFSTGRNLRLFTTANLDIALSQSLNDTTTNARLTDAGILYNFVPFAPTSTGTYFPKADGTPSTKATDEILERLTAVAAGYKIFNTVSYLIAGVSGHELKGSPLEGSYVTLAYAHRLLSNPEIPAGTDTTSVNRPRSHDNLYVEFFVRVPGAQFLDKLRIRGGVLLPLRSGYKVESRIVLAVPIVDLTRF